MDLEKNVSDMDPNGKYEKARQFYMAMKERQRNEEIHLRLKTNKSKRDHGEIDKRANVETAAQSSHNVPVKSDDDKRQTPSKSCSAGQGEVPYQWHP